MIRIFAFLFLLFSNYTSAHAQDSSAKTKAEIDSLEKKLREGAPGSFDWNAHNSLRHLYLGVDPAKSLYHVDTIFENSPFDEYTLMTIGAREKDKKIAIQRLSDLAQQYPQYQHLVATCWAEAGKLADNAKDRQAYFDKAIAASANLTAIKEHLEDYQWFKLSRERTWPAKILPPKDLSTRPGPWSDPTYTKIWPNQTSRANSDPWLAQHHDEIRLMRPRLLIINFSNEHSTAHLKKLTYQLINALAESSRYHGYKDPDAPIFLDYQVLKVVDLRDRDRKFDDSRVTPNKTPGKKTPFNLKYRSFFNDEFARYYGIPDPEDRTRFLRLNELLDGGYVHEVWCFFSSGKGALTSGYEVVEEKPRYDNQFQKIGDEWIQAGNGGDPQQPWVGRSCRINFLDCTRGIGCGMENLAHGLERFATSNAIPYFSEYFVDYCDFNFKARYNLPVDSFYQIQTDKGNRYESSELVRFKSPNELSFFHNGSEHQVSNYIAHGGNAHFPPNGRNHYDLQNTEPVLSTIEDWRIGSGANGEDIAKPFTNRAFIGYNDIAPDCMGSWLVYWRQNMPGLDNKQKDKLGKPMKNWIPFLFY